MCFEAWLLLSELALLTPLPTTARLLKAFKFPDIIHDTIQWVTDFVSRQQPRITERKPNLDVVDSISASNNASSPRPSQLSKKRKRGIDNIDTRPFELQDVLRLQLCLCSSLNLLLELSNGTQADSDSYATEHLKSALKTSVHRASSIFGSSLHLVYILRHNASRGEDPHGSEAYAGALLPMVKYWKLHTRNAENSIDQTVHVSVQNVKKGYILNRVPARFFTKLFVFQLANARLVPDFFRPF